MENNKERTDHPPPQPGDELVFLQSVLTETEGRIICDLLQSGGIDAMLHGNELSGYGMIYTSVHGGAGEVLVHARDLEEARNFVRMWQTPLLEESDKVAKDG